MKPYISKKLTQGLPLPTSAKDESFMDFLLAGLKERREQATRQQTTTLQHSTVPGRPPKRGSGGRQRMENNPRGSGPYDR